ncbi:hypothetical protein BpHYR1_053959 [Brachionus plicatilis]|uniref:Uncharacterized protein n=1 Tax=Brachionus plicatilis TaxID=10195 RepID=A0A3M7PP97_BRAPC|nr:hypothetical protein BpHYR1_053959 [Brachionus plicatilis]
MLYMGLWMLIDKYGKNEVANSAGGLGFLVMSAVAISYLAHILEKREKMGGEAEPVRSGPKPTPDDKKFNNFHLVVVK